MWSVQYRIQNYLSSGWSFLPRKGETAPSGDIAQVEAECQDTNALTPFCSELLHLSPPYSTQRRSCCIQCLQWLPLPPLSLNGFWQACVSWLIFYCAYWKGRCVVCFLRRATACRILLAGRLNCIRWSAVSGNFRIGMFSFQLINLFWYLYSIAKYSRSVLIYLLS